MLSLVELHHEVQCTFMETSADYGRLTVFRGGLDHVDFVNLFGVVLRVGVVLSAALLSVPAHLLQQLFSAVIQGQHLIGHLTGAQGLRRAGQSQFAEDLTPDGLHALLLDVVDVHRGAGRQGEAEGEIV